MRSGGTYIWHTTVSACADLRLVCVDEDTRVAKRASATIARNDTLLGPAHGLLVNEVDGCHRSRLRHCQPMSLPTTVFTAIAHVQRPTLAYPVRTWSSMIVCSKRGPTMAFSRGCWLLLQMPLRLGACMVRICSPASTLSCRTLSRLPSEDVGVALVAETGECGSLGLGLLAGTGLSVTVL